MNFKEAIEKLLHGEKIRRRAWEKGFYIHKIEGIIKSYRQEAFIFQYDLDIITSDDWIVVGKCPEKNYLFSEIILHLMQGEKVKLKGWPDDCYLESTKDHQSLFMRRICEHNFTPTFECFSSNDWEIIA